MRSWIGCGHGRRKLLGVCALGISAAATGQPLGTNLLTNSGFESDLAEWTTDHGAIRTASPAPHSGLKYLMGGMDGSANSYTYQTIDLIAAGFEAQALDSEDLLIRYGGWQSGWQTQTDSGKIEIHVTDGTNVLATADLGWFYSNSTWILKEGSVALPAGARFITYGFHAKRSAGTNNDGYLDDAFLALDSAIAPPRITDIRRTGDSLTLTVTDLTPHATNTVERTAGLIAGPWTDIDTFVAGDASADWSGLLDPAWARMFYRIRSE